MTVAAILRNKGTNVSTIAPEATVETAVERLRAENIGALVVSRHGTDIVGIISERDIVIGLTRHGAKLLAAGVSEIMTTAVRTCTPEDEIGQLMLVMTEYRIRHLPVLVEGKLGGIVSIGDVVKKRLEEVEFERDVMRDYVTSH